MSGHDWVGKGNDEGYLTESEIHPLMAEALAKVDLNGKKVLIIIPDSTRTAPLPLFFRLFHELLWRHVTKVYSKFFRQCLISLPPFS